MVKANQKSIIGICVILYVSFQSRSSFRHDWCNFYWAKSFPKAEIFEAVLQALRYVVCVFVQSLCVWVEVKGENVSSRFMFISIRNKCPGSLLSYRSALKSVDGSPGRQRTSSVGWDDDSIRRLYFFPFLHAVVRPSFHAAHGNLIPNRSRQHFKCPLSIPVCIQIQYPIITSDKERTWKNVCYIRPFTIMA